jgi:hypothetical protein
MNGQIKHIHWNEKHCIAWHGMPTQGHPDQNIVSVQYGHPPHMWDKTRKDATALTIAAEAR